MAFPSFDHKFGVSEVLTLIAFLLSAGMIYGGVTSRLSVLEEKTKQHEEMLSSMQGLKEHLIKLEIRLQERMVDEERLEKKIERLEETIKYGKAAQGSQ